MKTFITLLLLLSFGSVRAADLFIEAESFSNKGGWKVDQQFMDLMGSPYLLAHGMGVPVDDLLALHYNYIVFTSAMNMNTNTVNCFGYYDTYISNV